MKYIQPVGAEADAPYIDANPAAGIEGSPVPAAAIEHPQREIMEVIEDAGLNPNSENLAQLLEAIKWNFAWVPFARYAFGPETGDIADVFVGATGAFTPPDGTRFVEFLLIGGGGDGNTSNGRERTCGGGSGATIVVRAKHTPGDTYTLTIGAKGVGSGSEYGGYGGDTSVVAPTWSVVAGGGQGGTPDHAIGGGVSAEGITPVFFEGGCKTSVTYETDTDGGAKWLAHGASSPLMAHGGSTGQGSAPGLGGLGRSSGLWGCDGGPGYIVVCCY